MRSRLARIGLKVSSLWYAFANTVGAFLEEAAFRTSLAWAVLRGKAPKAIEKRWWNRSLETPILIDVYDWTNERHIFSVLVWPSLEVPVDSYRDAARMQRERAEMVKEVIARGAAEKMWSTRFEVDYGLRWNHERQVWAAQDGFAYASGATSEARRERDGAA